MTHLGVLQKGVLVVDTASAAVLQGVFTSGPRPTEHCLLPGLMDAEVGCVDETALDDVREVFAEVFEGHPKSERAELGYAALFPSAVCCREFSDHLLESVCG